MLEHETDMADLDAVAAKLENLSALWQDASDEERLQIAAGLIEAVWVDLDAKKGLVQLGADTLAIGTACDGAGTPLAGRANRGHCGAAAADILCQDISASVY